MSAAEQSAALRPHRLLGLLLIEMGLITAKQLEQALAAQQEGGERLGEVLIARGYTSRLAIEDALARQSGFLLEPEGGYGSGLRAKLVEGENRPGPAVAEDQPPWRESELFEPHRLDLQLEPRPTELERRELDAARRGLAEPLGGLPSADSAALAEREADASALAANPTDDFLAAVWRAQTYLAARRAALRGVSDALCRHDEKGASCLRRS